ncbi:tyrosine-type recombinase/integrase [Actinokineospora diospyrosa]|uniref:Site-specific recombinase XerD n=1 Tax=Actinokineospora diospyrosa TaxID=103728 RepID=A0ABT1IEH1_9PSEU|nr:tyrosine-type recombinase/integrase [Actinokineospora diospyrosa]MCP2271032.1 Site-specific recombinase XerD [Actinokineospora diospyrosa]
METTGLPARTGTLVEGSAWPGVGDPIRLLAEVTAWLRSYGAASTRRTYAGGLGLPTSAAELREWLSRADRAWIATLRDYADVLDLTAAVHAEVTEPRGNRPPTREGRFRALHWFRWCATTGVDPLAARSTEVLTWQDALRAAGAAPATRTRMLATVRTLYQHLATAGLVAANPADLDRRRLGLRDPQPAKTVVTLTTGQVAALLTAAATRRPGASPRDRLRARAVVALFTLGLRVSELCDLDHPDVHTTRGRRALRVTGKGGKIRTVYLSDLAEGALADYLNALPASPVATVALASSPPRTPLLVSRAGTRCDRRDVWSLLRRLAIAAELPELAGAMHPHALRHFYVTTAMEQGARITDVQTDVGHARVDTTQRVYNHAAPHPDRSAAAGVGEAITRHLR